ncbi:hypothetical protein V1477_007735 [Vespula maculifrons]|uniref:Uncharacterized protein n=1 Tax=Vespula maculifrons TaxID=7453 RepID=A0ABD2CFK7_VESMC
MEEKKETTRRYRLQLNSMFRAKVSGQFSTVYRTDIFVVELDEENWDDLVSTGPTSEGDIVEVGLGLETQRKREREKREREREIETLWIRAKLHKDQSLHEVSDC